MLIVGCGCRGRALAGALATAGHQVRGTSRQPATLEALSAVGVEAVSADPDRLGTLVGHLRGVSVLCWLLGSATGNAEALHGPRLQSLLETLVDTPVRGLVYEGQGSVSAVTLAAGAERVREASATFRMPGEVVTVDPADHERWLAAMVAAVERVLAA
ncbi:MAG TPA: NAD(P)-binding domain-containing protein [Thermoleophilaceae bacterium]